MQFCGPGWQTCGCQTGRRQLILARPKQLVTEFGKTGVYTMRTTALGLSLISGLACTGMASADGGGMTKPNLVTRQDVQGMPKGDRQQISVLTAQFKPDDKTVYHSHRYPVSVYVLEGIFTLELEGRKPVVVKAGEAFVEPPNVRMTGYNRSTTDALKVVIFYVAEPESPFLDPVK